jgi:cytochrome oxidase Cu insertion factor (SCO1/SenC/PrrC family)
LFTRRLLAALTVPLALCVGGLALAVHRACPAHAIPEALVGISLRDQQGASLPIERLADKLLVLNFVFTRCGSVCPTQTRELAKARQALPEDLRSRVRFLSVSLDPEHDSAQALREFAEVNQAAHADWFFVTAPPAATQGLVARLQLNAAPAAPSAEPQAAAPANHGTAVYLFDGHGRLMQRYLGAPLDRARLANDIARLARVTGS